MFILNLILYLFQLPKQNVYTLKVFIFARFNFRENKFSREFIFAKF